jgi:nucleoside-diphosphate-sugar epimerase
LSGPYAVYSSRIEIFAVPDITVPGAFDQAVAGVHGIFHTASPVTFSQVYEEVIPPAVAGTETLLNSALAHAGPQLEAVVVTSSAASVVDPKPGPYTFTEADYASQALTTTEANRAAGTPTPGGVVYAASKQAAERAVWHFKDTHAPPFAISTIHPTVTIGPPVLLPADPAKLNSTLQPTYDIFVGKPIPPTIGSGSFVDVRDVALTHLWTYEHAALANGERFIASQGYGPPQALADILREAYPDRRGIIQEGKPGDGYVGYEDGVVKEVQYPPGRARVSGEKAQKAMGVRFRTFKESVIETAKAMERYL